MKQDIEEYFKDTKFGYVYEVINMLVDEGYSEDEATKIIDKETDNHPSRYEWGRTLEDSFHTTYGAEGRLNNACNQIRDLIQEDVKKVLESGYRPQIEALATDFQGYLDIIASFEDESVEGD